MLRVNAIIIIIVLYNNEPTFIPGYCHCFAGYHYTTCSARTFLTDCWHHLLFHSTDVPKLPPLPIPGEENVDDDDEEQSKEDRPQKQRKISGPKAINPYANDESSMLIPIAVAIAVFLPTLFCLCKL